MTSLLLQSLALRPDKPILVVSTPAATIAAQKIVGDAYIAIPYPEGADFSPFYTRKLLLWPDSDNTSRQAMKTLAEALYGLAAEVKILVVDGVDGWNAANALEEGWDFKRLVEWAKPRAVVFNIMLDQRTTIINNEAEPEPDPVPASAQAVWEQCGLAMSAQGQPILNLDNVNRLLSRWVPFADLIWFDEFHQRYLTKWRSSKGKIREWKEIDDLRFTHMLQEEFGLSRLGDDIVRKALMIYAHTRVRNEPKDWMGELVWDGRKRIDRFFMDYIGADESPYIYAISRNFWIGMVARIFQPGCQLDNMIILEGKQGIFKSSALRAIGGAWYMEAHEQVTSKDFFQVIDGRLVVEISELDAFSKAEGTRVKQVITCSVDRYRASYGHRAEDHPRRCVFVGSTNEEHYLKEAGRRFWPVKCGVIRLEDIKKDREQLFAEAVVRFKRGEDWYQVPEGETAAQQEARRQQDEWENLTTEFVYGRSQTTLTELAAYLGVDKGKLDHAVQKRIGGILRRMGWTSLTVRKDFTSQRVWVPPAAAAPDPLLSLGQDESSPDSVSPDHSATVE